MSRNFTLEIGSEFRDRSKWPSVSQFGIQVFSYRGQTDSNNEHIRDPIVDAYPSFRGTIAPSQTTESLINLGGTGTNTQILDAQRNAYVQYIFSITDFGGVTQFRSVAGYEADVENGIFLLQLGTPLNFIPVPTTPPEYSWMLRREYPISYDKRLTDRDAQIRTNVILDATETPRDYSNTYIWFPESDLHIRIRRYNVATRTAVLTSAPPINIGALSRYELHALSGDNYRPVLAVGLPPFPRWYWVSLIEVLMPNRYARGEQNIMYLKSGYGGTIGDYPFFYLTLQTTNHPNQHRIFSNNPNARRACFRVSVYRESTESSFTRLSAPGRQLLYLNFVDELVFSINLPDGSLLEYDVLEFATPRRPYSRMQITALFDLALASSADIEAVSGETSK